jgi:hypothetical protein
LQSLGEKIERLEEVEGDDKAPGRFEKVST